MLECYLVKENITTEVWLPVMVYAARYEAEIVAEAFGDDEFGHPIAEVINIPFAP